ncbi:phage tail protein [Lactiplantibacillus plantarum]|uniref:phage tail protein n=1 Tax=Lactiplantibacillus plantarum TaxID=1590 RepID=UPI0022718044|nr:phage tail protein [Lactiplantibacillus plantarum]MDO7795603.1 phage tail protein [Lactiplantibacillus plantarum]
MIKFYDSAGAVYYGQATITRKTSVNGGLSLTGEVFAGDDVLNGLDYGWWLNFDNEKYVITYKKLSDDTNTVVFDAVQQFFWDFAKVALHAQYTGSHEYSFYLGQLFDKSGYTYKNDVAVPAFEKENWGYKNKLDLFNDIMDQAGVEFEVHNEIIHIAKQIGSDLTSFVRKGINLSNLTEEMKISDFATYAKGYGAFKDSEDQSKGRLEVEYRSELAKKFGDLEMDPIVDERYTVADNLIAALKKQVDATYTVSMTMNIYDLENAGYPNYEAPKVGDWILAIDEALNFKRKIRIIQLEEQFDVTGKRIGYTATCGDLSIVDQYTHLQSSLDSKVQRIQETVDTALTSANGKNTNYYGAKEPVSANEGDLWFDQSDSDPDKWSVKQWVNGRWQQITLNPGEVEAKVDAAKKEAETAVENAKNAADKADQIASKYDDTQELANQALSNSLLAQTDAADSLKKITDAVTDATNASTIANAVQQKVTTLTDGSTMTIAELENGLATKLVKSDLDGYATKTWASNEISTTADGINATIGKVQTSLDNTTTTVNSLAANSLGIKLQLSSLNTQATQNKTDIATLQSTASSLTSNMQTLQSSNLLTKMNVSQLQQTSTTMNSTLMDVQTAVQNSAVGTNLLLNTGTPYTMTANGIQNQWEQIYRLSRQIDSGTQLTLSFDVISTADCKFIIQNNANNDGGTWNSFVRDALATTETKHYVSTLTLDGYSKQGINLRLDGVPSGTKITISNMKLEVGSFATDFSVNPADNATVTQFSSLQQTVNSIQSTVADKASQTQVTQLATQLTSTVSGLGQKNLVYNSELTSSTDGWSSNANIYLGTNQYDHYNGSNSLVVHPSGVPLNTWSHAYSKLVPVVQGMKYSASGVLFITGNIEPTATGIYIEIDFFDANGNRVGNPSASFDVNKWQEHQYLKIEGIVAPNTATTLCYAIQLNGTANLIVNHPMLVAADKVGLYQPDTIGSSEYTQLQDDINLRVTKNGVVNAVNISPEGIQIYGNKLHITASTYIDNAVIKSAMIAGLDAGKINTGVLNANLVNVININGANITANTITANQLAVGSVLVNLNNTLQTLRITTDGIFTTDSKGANVGHIHSNYLVGHPDLYGLAFDLDAEGDYMTWGAQNRGQPTSNYTIKLGWYRNDIASTIGSPAGFVFGDPATFNKPVTFTGGIKVPNAGSNLTTGTSSFNSYAYPYFGDDGMKAGWAYGTSETYLISGGSFYNASKIIKALNNLGALQLPQSIRSDGTVAKYYNVTL